MKLVTHLYYLKNRHTFRIAHGSRTGIETFILSLSDETFTGYGEATPVPYYGFSADNLQSLIHFHQAKIEHYELGDPADFWEFLNPFLKINRFAQCALDMAAYDLVSKKKGIPLYEYLRLSLTDLPLSNYTIGIDAIPKMIERIKEVQFPIYKIKLGTENDLEIVKELRKHSSAIFRVDANCAWSAEETLKNAYEFKQLGVEFIEQPLAPALNHEMPYVLTQSKLPIIADESCISEEDVDNCIGRFDGVNVKLAKCGGITPALRMLKKAKENNLKTMVGCMTESSVGISAIGHLAPLLDYMDADGALLIENDPAEGVQVKNGQLIFPNRNGTGAVLNSF